VTIDSQQDRVGALLQRANGHLGGEIVYRHTRWVRIWHWINVLAIIFLLGSGLNIFNAHPRLYWGAYGDDADPALFSLYSVEDHNGASHGITQIGSVHIDTTGTLGWSTYRGEYSSRGWPSWATIPSFQDLADARHWHFLFAWILVLNFAIYITWSVRRRHLQIDIVPTLRDLRSIPKSVSNHIRFKHPTGDAAKRYNVLQRLAYVGVLLLLVVMVATGLTMSPAIDAFLPWLLDVFGGRQTARTLHFLSAALIVLFVFVHVAEVFIAGVVNEMRSMITGYYRVPSEHKQ